MFIEREMRCINCGNAGIPVWRNRGHQHKDQHRKKMYCPHCKADINHIEIKTYEEREEFLEKWKRGDFKDEAEESLAFGGVSGQR